MISPIDGVPDVDLLQERLNNLEFRFDGLSKKIKATENERERAKLHLEQIGIEEKMTECKMELYREARGKRRGWWK